MGKLGDYNNIIALLFSTELRGVEHPDGTGTITIDGVLVVTGCIKFARHVKDNLSVELLDYLPTGDDKTEFFERANMIALVTKWEE